MLSNGSSATLASQPAASLPRVDEPPTLSVVVPVHDEEGNVEPLAAEITAVLDRLGEPYEIIFVDDGSTDATADRLAATTSANTHLRVLELDGNFGEAAALSAGFHAARGDVVLTLDGDGQNDPADLPRLLETLRARKLVAVSGRRERRQEKFWLRVLPSRIANALIVRVTGIPVYDCGCGLKAYRREAVAQLHLPYGLHRFLPAILGVRPDQVAEVFTRDRVRGSGHSHYGLSRAFAVLRDLLAVPFLIRDPRAAHLHFSLATAAVAALGAALFESRFPLAITLDVVAAGLGSVWWNARRFNRAQAEGVYRLRREISQHVSSPPEVSA